MQLAAIGWAGLRIVVGRGRTVSEHLVEVFNARLVQKLPSY